MIAIAAAVVLLAAPTPARGIVADPCAAVAAQRGIDSHLVDFGQLCRYRDENRLLAASGARTRVVMFGDSITEFWIKGDPSLFRKGVIDRGISGQTTSQMLVRFRQDVIALRPAAVHIMAGTNDIAGNTGPTTIDNIVANIRSMIELARAYRIRVILGSALPAAAFNWAPEQRPAGQIAELNRRLRALARSEGLQFVDYYGLLANRQGGMDPADAADGVHPTAHGYERMRPLAERAIATAR